MAKSKNALLFTIIFTIFLDMLGIGIVIPVMAPLFLDEHYQLVATAHTTQWRTVALGALFASFSLSQFIGAPILGALGDRLGRKKVLVFALFGTFIGYLLFATAIQAQLLWLLFLARILDGFTGGNVSIIFSIITDISEGESRTKNFGMVGAAFGLGFIIGPYIGGKLADPSVVSWFTYATPFWFAAMLSALNIVLVLFLIPETRHFDANKPKTAEKRLNIWAGVSNIMKIKDLPQLRILFLIAFLFTFGFSFFTQFFQVFLIQKFQYTQSSIGDLFAYMGLWIAATQGGLMRIVSKRFKAYQVPKISFLLLSLSFFALLIPNNYVFLYFILPIVSIAQGITSPNLLTLVSEQSDPEMQGTVMGIQQSVQSLAQAIPPIVAGFIVSFNINLPITAAATAIFAAWVIFTKNAHRWTTTVALTTNP